MAGAGVRVVFPDCTPYMAQFFDGPARALVPELELRVARPAAAELVEALSGAAGVVHFQTKLTEPILAACPDLRLIVFLGTGVWSWVDLPAAERRGIRVRRVLGYADRTVAEHAIALVFDGVRRVAQMDREIRAGTWRQAALFELAGKTLGIVGLGGIGRATARLGAGVGLRVIGWNRGAVAEDVPCERRSLEEVLTEADIVSLHLALNDETRGILDRRRLGLLKPGAVFINTARGGLVDQVALAERLASGHIAAAGLDVFAEEPVPPDHPLTRLANVTLTAHAAWMSPEAARRLVRSGLEALREELDRL
ncbi:MAG TPA: NAD(P)-dependent oxidoreductase [Methylomirabilota bacterium]|jgi:D-3-phosphoglycerate dehydrogenase|nr:NAD(P)-dependent oxidoreductase [Methylomirabilota bacterium]